MEVILKLFFSRCNLLSKTSRSKQFEACGYFGKKMLQDLFGMCDDKDNLIALKVSSLFWVEKKNNFLFFIFEYLFESKHLWKEFEFLFLKIIRRSQPLTPFRKMLFFCKNLTYDGLFFLIEHLIKISVNKFSI